MNILFFLTPKSDVAYIFEDETLRQTVEKMEHRKFSCIPILNKEGQYTGTISEGDLLWGIKLLNINSTDLKEMENVSIMAIPRRATYKPVHADADMEDLLDRAINQNYVPVVDDKGSFIGIITRKEIIKYCYKEMKKLSALHEKQETSEQ
nr:CBS domain-containing protein [uncultured Blautia sp.]